MPRRAEARRRKREPCGFAGCERRADLHGPIHGTLCLEHAHTLAWYEWLTADPTARVAAMLDDMTPTRQRGNQLFRTQYPDFPAVAARTWRELRPTRDHPPTPTEMAAALFERYGVSDARDYARKLAQWDLTAADIPERFERLLEAHRERVAAAALPTDEFFAALRQVISERA